MVVFSIPWEFPGKKEPLPGNSQGVGVVLSVYLKGVLIMTAVPFTVACSLLAVDPKTLRQWLKRASLSLHQSPTDARVKCLTSEQVHLLANLHGRVLPAQPSAASHEPSQIERHLAPVSLHVPESLERLTQLEAQVTSRASPDHLPCPPTAG